MRNVDIQTPSRLHLGLLGWGPEAARQFGGVGLMIENPGLRLIASNSEKLSATGPLATRALNFAARAIERDPTLSPAQFQIIQAPPEHVGLGTGTQLGLAVVRALTRLSGQGEVSLERLAHLSGRGLRSGIGLHGFEQGGLIVDGGRRTDAGIPPLVIRQQFPPEWRVVLVIPSLSAGLHGSDEIRAFAKLPPIPPSVTDRLCRRVLLGLIPAIAERDLHGFGEAIEAIQAEVGASFSPAQGGIYAHKSLEAIVDQMRRAGLTGVGQSSWGPALYGFFDESMIPQSEQARRIEHLLTDFQYEVAFTRAVPTRKHSTT